jgi:hypothetical protein
LPRKYANGLTSGRTLAATLMGGGDEACLQ